MSYTSETIDWQAVAKDLRVALENKNAECERIQAALTAAETERDGWKEVADSEHRTIAETVAWLKQRIGGPWIDGVM